MNARGAIRKWVRRRMFKLKKFYLKLIETEKKNILETSLWVVLYVLSLVYSLIVAVRNYLYSKGILPIHSQDAKLISIGNISWGGSGKTSLAIYLHKRLKDKFNTAVITKGYARDEFLLLKDKLNDVFDAKDRVSLIRRLDKQFDLFILDDGFQYRKLKRDLDIVVMGAKEFRRKHHLIPAYIFRESLSSLNRADIVVLTYWRGTPHIDSIRKRLFRINPHLKVYLADYQFKEFLDKEKRAVSSAYFKNKRIAVLTAIGYPQGFLDKLKEVKIEPKETLVYPDHYEFNAAKIAEIEDELKRNRIKDVIITHKDFYHLDLTQSSLNYFILEVELEVKDSDKLIGDISRALEK